ncbi:MAG: SCP2 sterol-binding domain-containing protein [Oscillospiraceae bacterium]|nr:SCP2 sterol-binding domain-containing protein [Oscillospiraceae bacterium]
MNNVELSAKVKGYLKGSAAKAKKFEDLVAVSISLLSENPEDMYVAVREGKILVDHYPYDDNNCAVEASAETIDKLFSGEMSFDKALDEGFVKVRGGDAAKFKALEVLVSDKKSKEDKSTKSAKSDKPVKAAAKPAAKPAAKSAPKASKGKKK